jgi:hypothetical protein
MAEFTKTSAGREGAPSFDHQPADGAEVAYEIQGLRAELAELRALVAEKTGAAYGGLSDRAASAANYVSSEASSVAGTFREHPAASTTLVTLIGAVGFALGYIVATNTMGSQQAWYRRYLIDRF